METQDTILEKFRGVIILEGQDYGAQEVNERRPEGQMGGPHAAPVPGRVGPPPFSLVALMPSIFAPLAPS